jgi:hypothetical protein
MPGVGFDVLRREITIQQVLDEIGFQATHRDGDQLRGPCPVHGSTSKHSRVFSVSLSDGRHYCHKRKSHGNQLELYAAQFGLSFEELVLPSQLRFRGPGQQKQ